MTVEQFEKGLGILALIVLITLFIFCIASIPESIDKIINPPLSYKTVRDLCLECGYSDSQRSSENGYCIRLESGTEIVVPMESACDRHGD